MKVVRRSSGLSAWAHVSPRKRRIFTVFHFSSRRAAHWIAGSVIPSMVIGVDPAQVVSRCGVLGT
jgi:hypothetical protein